MNRSSAELKSLARATLQGKYGTFIGTYAIYMLIVFAASTIISFSTLAIRGSSAAFIIQLCLQLIISFVGTIFGVGFIYQSMQACRGKKISIDNLFYGFSHNPDRYIIVVLLTILFTIALMLPAIIFFAIGAFIGASSNGSLVLMFVGLLLYIVAIVFLIIMSLALSLCYYLIIDNPEMSAMESIKTSWKLMKGHKGRFFYISLSFIGLSLLGLLSFGIGTLWIFPYMNVTTTYFYFDVIGALDAPVVEVAAAPVAPVSPVAPVAQLVEPVANPTTKAPYVDDPVIHNPSVETVPSEESPVVSETHTVEETPVVEASPAVETPVAKAPAIESPTEPSAAEAPTE